MLIEQLERNSWYEFSSQIYVVNILKNFKKRKKMCVPGATIGVLCISSPPKTRKGFFQYYIFLEGKSGHLKGLSYEIDFENVDAN
jgi:hypothetical protein